VLVSQFSINISITLIFLNISPSDALTSVVPLADGRGVTLLVYFIFGGKKKEFIINFGLYYCWRKKK